MTLLPQEVVMGNLQDVAETATAGVAAACAICAAAAAATAAVKMPLRYASMNAKCCMLNVIVCLIQWIMYIVVNLFKRPQKIGIHNICYWCGQRSKQTVCPRNSGTFHTGQTKSDSLSTCSLIGNFNITIHTACDTLTY